MASLSPVTGHVDADTLALIDRLAAARGLTSVEYVSEAIRRTTESDGDLFVAVQEGSDAIDRGEFVTHNEVMAELDAMIGRHRDRCRD